MSLECSFGGKDEEEMDLNELAKEKDKEMTIENILNDNDIEPNNENQIFNQISTKEINNGEEIDQIEYYQSQIIQEKINLSLNTIFTVIKNRINNYKNSFFHKMKLILNKKYSNLVAIQLLYMQLKNKFEKFLFLTRFIQYKLIQKAFNNIKIYTHIKKKEIEEEQNLKKEKENKINVINNKITSLNNGINDLNKKINGLDNILKKLNGENKDIKNKISQMNEKINQLIKYGNTLRENITNKKNNMNNNINGKNNENRIQNLKDMIEQKENEKEREMKDIDAFCENMNLVLNQYESMSETILSNCNINSNK